MFREENFPRDEVTGGNFWIKCLSRSSVLVERIRPFPRLKIIPAFLMALHSLNSPRKTRREREKCEILFLLCAEKIERAGERKKYPIGLDWIGLGKFLVPYPLSGSFGRLLLPSFEEEEEEEKKTNEALTICDFF